MSIVYLPFVYGSLYRMAVKQVRGEPVSASDIFGGLPVMLRMLGLIILIWLAGLVLQLVLSAVFSVLHLGGATSGQFGANGTFPTPAQVAPK